MLCFASGFLAEVNVDGWWQGGEFENTGRMGLEKGGRDLQQKHLKLRTRNRGQESQQHRRGCAKSE